MKPNLTKLSLGLLSAVFIFGCQDLGSGPVEPDGLVPQFDKKGVPGTDCDGVPGGPERDLDGHCHGDDGDTGGDNPGSPFYQYTFKSDVITTTPSTAGGFPDARDGVFLNCCAPGGASSGGEELNLSRVLFQGDNDVDRQTCFGATYTTADWSGRLFPKQGVKDVMTRFLFDAFDKGGREIRYRLLLDGIADPTVANGDLDDGIFPPEVDENTTVTFSTFSIGAQRNKEKNACSGAGDLSQLPGFFTTTEILGVDVDPG